MIYLKGIKKQLEKFGLSDKQALIYLLLIQHGNLRIQEIVNLSQIPRSSVYENIKSLFELGLVEEIIEDNYKKIRPYPITTIKYYLKEKIIQFQKQTADLNQIEKALEKLPSMQSPALTTVRFYKGVSGARQLLWNTLKAKDLVYVYSGWGRGTYVGIQFYQDFVKESYIRQIKERVLVNPTVHVINSIQKYSGTSVARTSPKDIKALSEKDIVIKGETFIYDNIYALVYLKNEEIHGFEIESDSFTKMQKSIFETLWDIAKPISDFL